MIFLAPFIVHGTHSITPEDISRYKTDYVELIHALQENRVDIETARRLSRINDPQQQVIQQLETM